MTTAQTGLSVSAPQAYREKIFKMLKVAHACAPRLTWLNELPLSVSCFGLQ